MTLVLVEGESDEAAVRAAARLLGCDLESPRFRVLAAHGVTNFPRLLVEFVAAHAGAESSGLYDVAGEAYVRRALAAAGAPVDGATSLESFGFFACVDDLEDELIRALGADAVERVIDAQGELRSFRRFQAMPQHAGTPVDRQLHRFLGTQATRKIRSAERLVEALEPNRLPRPLARLVATLMERSAPR